MNPSAACFSLIKRCEGCQLTAYADSVGVMTVGVGHTGPDVHTGLVWTQAQADAALASDTADAAASVAKMAKNCTQGQFDALVSFVFNLGSGALAGSTLLQLHNAGRYPEAAAEFVRWSHAGGRVLSGLVKRRARETLLYLGEPT